MNKNISIGVDIGGTNTDIVVVDSNKKVVAFYKTPTTDHIADGFYTGIKTLMTEHAIDPETITGVFVGTTHATNALLRAKDLHSVGVIRLAGHNPVLPCCFMWPRFIKDVVFTNCITVDGGFDCDGSVITQLCTDRIRSAARSLVECGAETIALVGVFSPMNHTQEIAAYKIIQEEFNNAIAITMSHMIGGIGFIERENSTILNCALKKTMAKGFSDLSDMLKKLAINVPLLVTQNNGTLISLQDAIEYPVFTIAAGPTNSFIGAVKLANCENAIIVDIGGTSTDVGIVHNWFARRSVRGASIAGIELNFSMPDVLSIALGGGSYIEYHEGVVAIGPDSSGYKVLQESRSFGGNKLTLTDIALAQGTITIPGSRKIAIEDIIIQLTMDQVTEKIHYLVQKIQGIQKDMPVLLVGGGAYLCNLDMLGKQYSIPPYASIANAYGAALAEISATVDVVASITHREEVVSRYKQQALQEAVEKGADLQTTRIVSQQIIPFHYMPDNIARIVITAAGQRL